MKKHIIATDYDGTLFQYHKGGITDELREKISEFRKAGHLFGVVTGRCFRWSYPVFSSEKKFEFDFIISNNGSQCCDSEGNFLFSDKIPADSSFAKKIVDKMLSFGVEECGIALERDRYNFKKDLPDGDEYYNFHEVLDEITYVVSTNAVCFDEEQAKNLATVLEEEFGEYISPARNGRCLDISAKGINKATSIAKYAKIMGVDEDNIYSAGDNYNDMVMIEAFHGCAVENAVDALKNNAEFVVSDVGEIADMILFKE